jgi:ssDNA-binding Zn-finger/Zn-ribbon topoisomerase 1
MLAREHRAITTHKCPKCGTHKVRRANRYGTLDRVLSFVNIYPYRCCQCLSQKRFYSFGRR